MTAARDVLQGVNANSSHLGAGRTPVAAVVPSAIEGHARSTVCTSSTEQSSSAICTSQITVSKAQHMPATLLC
jgi:hypothetical protein